MRPEADGLALEARELSCGYDSRPVVQALNLALRPGEVLALVGPNGSGKTTVLRALARLLRPRAGTAMIAGRSVWQLAPKAVARLAALVPQQESPVWALTVEQVVALGRLPHRHWWSGAGPADRRHVEAALKLTELWPLRHRPVTRLSGGEQRRVVLARALAQAPRFLLLDEPTAHLDLGHAARLLRLLRYLAREEGLAILATMHDLNEAAAVADRMGLLWQGQLVGLGTPAEVLQPRLLEGVFQIPCDVVTHPAYGTPMVVARWAVPAERPRAGAGQG